jgi:tRNA threonylcarbamoyladenosine biosynthesis protein TsaB
MAFILSLETSTTVCSVALHKDGALLAHSENHVAQSAASQLAVQIRHVLEVASIEARVLNAITVSSGPGSYTGLRIGVATAKGMCYSLNIPLIAVSALELMATTIRPLVKKEAWLCPMLDARRMEVYTALFDTEMKQVEPVQAMIVDNDSFAAVLKEHHVLFFGNGSDKCRDMIRHDQAEFVSGIYPSAAAMGRLALERYSRQLFEDTGSYEPMYLKDFIVKKPKSLS